MVTKAQRHKAKLFVEINLSFGGAAE